MTQEQVEATVTSSQNQSGITTKLQRDHPEESTKLQCLITKHRQKKPLHHNKTDRQGRASARGLVGLPQEAAEVPEEYFSGWGVPPEKCGV